MKERWPLFPKDFPKWGFLFFVCLFFWGGMGQLAHSLVVTIFDDFFFKFYLF